MATRPPAGGELALFHLDASIAPGARQAPLGPRGLSGPSYKGHVFWDSESSCCPSSPRPAPPRARDAGLSVGRIAAARLPRVRWASRRLVSWESAATAAT
jgi:hypothetical protein